jgi:hypothetical protein
MYGDDMTRHKPPVEQEYIKQRNQVIKYIISVWLSGVIIGGLLVWWMIA